MKCTCLIFWFGPVLDWLGQPKMTVLWPTNNLWVLRARRRGGEVGGNISRQKTIARTEVETKKGVIRAFLLIRQLQKKWQGTPVIHRRHQNRRRRVGLSTVISCLSPAAPPITFHPPPMTMRLPSTPKSFKTSLMRFSRKKRKGKISTTKISWS